MFRSLVGRHSRPVLVAAAALVVAGLLLPVSLAGPASAAQRPACTAAMTTVSFRVGGGAAGSIYGHLRVRNTSSRTCTIHGYGGVSYVGHGNGTQIGAASQRVAARVGTVTLRPGQVAQAQVRMVEAGNYAGRCTMTKVNGFRVYLPGETHSQFVRYSTTGCANTHVHLLSNWPYRAA
jgi:hypothetical protein